MHKLDDLKPQLITDAKMRFKLTSSLDRTIIGNRLGAPTSVEQGNSKTPFCYISTITNVGEEKERGQRRRQDGEQEDPR